MQNILESIARLHKNGGFTTILIIFLIFMVFSLVLTGFLYKWPYLIGKTIIMIVSSIAALIAVVVMQKNFEENENLKSFTGLIPYLAIYISIITYLGLSIIYFIIWTTIAIFRFKKSNEKGKKLKFRWLRKIFWSIAAVALGTPMIAATNAAFNTKKQNNDSFTNFSIQLMTGFKGINPTSVVSSIDKLFKTIDIGKEKIEELFEKDWNELSLEDQESFKELVDTIGDYLKEPNIKESLIKFIQTPKMKEKTNEALKPVIDEFKDFEKYVQERNPLYSQYNNEQKQEYLKKEIKSYVEKINKDDINEKAQVWLETFESLKKDTVKELSEVVGNILDQQLNEKISTNEKYENFSGPLFYALFEEVAAKFNFNES
ncbi:cation diffusion facilitator family transporter [Mycoplasmopsis sturni]|uniref:hypothetical protein n=1 Tax=Mycoplasmopsis sturni TaxID=39047 RepID=UPI0005652C1E|nr:hypothetical protein [Mycoplasmopsis sturni]